MLAQHSGESTFCIFLANSTCTLGLNTLELLSNYTDWRFCLWAVGCPGLHCITLKLTRFLGVPGESLAAQSLTAMNFDLWVKTKTDARWGDSHPALNTLVGNFSPCSLQCYCFISSLSCFSYSLPMWRPPLLIFYFFFHRLCPSLSSFPILSTGFSLIMFLCQKLVCFLSVCMYRWRWNGFVYSCDPCCLKS